MRIDRLHFAFVARAAMVSAALLGVSASNIGAQGVGTQDAGATNGAAILERIRADWQRRLFAMDRVRYVAVGTRTVFRGAYNGMHDWPPGHPPQLPPDAPENLPEADTTLETTQGALLDFANNRARRESIHHMFSPETIEFLPFHDVFVYDGAHFRKHRPNLAALREKHRAGAEGRYPIELYLRDLAELRFFFEAEQYPFFLNHGLVPLGLGITPDRLRPAAPEMTFAFHGFARDAGRDVVVLRSSATPSAPDWFSELWVDVDRQSAIVRWANRNAGGEWLRYELQYVQQGTDWQLDSWKQLNFDEGRLVRSMQMRVATLDIDPAVAVTDFQVEPAPGMVVNDPSYEGSRTGRYVQGATLDKRVPVEDLALPAGPSRLSRSRVALYAIVAAVVIAGALAVVRFVRRPRLRRPA